MIDRGSVLQITRNLPPLQGGMERVNARIAQTLASDWRVGVVGPAGCAAQLSSDVEVIEAPLKPLATFVVRAAISARRWAARNHPRIVLAGSGLTAPIVWWSAPRGSLRVTYVHGLDLVVDSLAYRLIWLPFLRRMDLVLTNSANTAGLAVAAGIASERIRILHPGTHLPIVDLRAGDEFRRLFELGTAPLLLSVGRLTPRKGMRAFVQHCLPDLRRAHPDLQLLIIGGDATQALNASRGSERERIAAAAVQAGVTDALRFLPPSEDSTLSAAYTAADVHVFPIREIPGDVEGFGMVAIEAAAHGLPTVAFRSGGVPDAIVEGVTGDLVTEGDYSALTRSILSWLARRHETERSAACRQAAARWSWENFDQRLRSLLDDALSNSGFQS